MWIGRAYNWIIVLEKDNLNEAKSSQLHELQELLLHIQQKQELCDEFVWWRDKSGSLLKITIKGYLNFLA